MSSDVMPDCPRGVLGFECDTVSNSDRSKLFVRETAREGGSQI